MEPLYVTAISAIGALITGVVSAYFSFRGFQLNKQEELTQRLLLERTDDLRRCYRQIASYHELESLACGRIAKLTDRSERTIQIELRDTVVSKSNCERPFITRNEAETQLSRLG